MQGSSGRTMRAAVRRAYGHPTEVVELAMIEKPVPVDDEVLVRIRAASANLADWYAVEGRPYVGRAAMGLFGPKTVRLGVDFAGTVEQVGAAVTQFQVGDEVFGGRDGAFAEYVCVREERALAHKPTGVTFAEAAAVPVAGLTALQGLRDRGRVQPGQRVLVHGASGGVGTFAVQIAKALGAEVTAVCSRRNVDLARSLGADHVVDYTEEDFTRLGRRYDVVFDVAGTRSWRELRRALEPRAIVVLVGGPRANRVVGPLGHIARTRLASLLSGRETVFFVAKFTKGDVETLRDLLESGALRPFVEREYGLTDAGAALHHIGELHCRGKVVIAV